MTGPDFERLQSVMRGELVRPDHPDYDVARRVYNGAIDRRPAAVARPADVADVIHAVDFARTNDLLVAVRGGGHSAAGKGTCDDGLVIDLSRLGGTRVDPRRATARVGGGATWGDFDHATHAFGLATPGGIFSTTGVGGLTLGGGFGYLSRTYGLSSDNLLSADVVTADGRFLTASADDHPDLFWALRGGGGNFGVVTSLEFQIHPVSTVYAGPVLYPLDRAAEVLRFYRDYMLDAPEDLSAFFAYLISPPAPFIPEDLQGVTVCGLVVCHLGPLEAAERDLRPIREVVPPVLDLAGPLPYPALNAMFDALVPPGMHHYWRSDFMTELSDEAIAVHLDFGPCLQNIQSGMHIYPLTGAPRRVGKTDTAFSYRDANFVHVIFGISPDGTGMTEQTAWVRSYWEALHPHSAGGTYVNFLMDEGDDRVATSYRENYARLAALKTNYDPGNLFRLNQNIRPLVPTA
ncbi:MAG TPA: FAD-binding oxidoreductase [Thermomicrobiales bacterium]|jgi:FAD/FMN-containing dehydrogenase